MPLTGDKEVSSEENDNSERPIQRILPPHYHVTILPGTKPSYSMLKQFVEYKPDKDLPSNIAILQLTHSLLDFFAQKLYPNSIVESNIHITHDKRRVVLLLRKFTAKPTENGEITSLKFFHGVIDNLFKSNTVLKVKKYSFVNKNREPKEFIDDSCPYEFEHFLKKLDEAKKWDEKENSTGQGLKIGVENLKTVLEHPLFWDSKKKLDFIIHVVDFANSQSGRSMKELFLDSSFLRKFCDKPDWRVFLELSIEEHGCVKALLSKKDIETRVKYATIVDLAKKYIKTYYRGNDACFKNGFFLIKFIRDKAEHFHDCSIQEYGCFNFDRVGGLFQFFNRRFPKLFYAVYDTVLKFKTIRNMETGLERVFFTPAKNIDYVEEADRT